MPGALSLVELLQAEGIRVAVVSGGIRLAVDIVLPSLSFDEVFINQLSFNLSGALVGGTPTAFDRSGKADALALLMQRFGLTTSQTAFVGDGANDHEIMAAAGLGIAWGPTPPPSLLALADHHAWGDLGALAPLLVGSGVGGGSGSIGGGGF